jgi:hypothetical protein
MPTSITKPGVPQRLSAPHSARGSWLRRLSVALVVGGAVAPAALAETLPAPLATQLHEVEDFAPHFDFPAYYALVEHVKSNPQTLGPQVEPTVIEDWETILATPSAFRGQVVRITGRVGMNKPPHRYPNHPALGYLRQLELYQPGSPLSATVICTSDVSDLPIDATVTIDAYFFSIKTFQTRRGIERRSLVLVGIAPLVVETAQASDQGDAGPDYAWLLAIGGGGLLIAWILLRWANRTPVAARDSLRARRAAPVNLSADLDAWASTAPDQRPDAPDPDAGEHRR